MKKPNVRGWEQLICPYFSPTCRRVLGAYLQENDFSEKGENEIGGLVLSRADIFLEISYELETAPSYALSIVLGTGDRKYDEGGHPCCVPYWYLLPPGRPEHRGAGVRFTNERELESLLTRFKDSILEPYAKPLWLNVEKLELTIANFRAEFSC
jgi:hypothetical protein